MYEGSAAADGEPGLIRRRVLHLGVTAAIAGLAGCTADEDDDTADDETADEDETGDEDDAMNDDGDGEDDDLDDNEDNDLDDEDDTVEDEEEDDESDGTDDEEGDDEDQEEDDEETGDEDEDDEEDEDREERDLSVMSYTNDEYGYELEIPEAWTIDEANPAEVYFYGPDPDELVVTTLAYPPETTLDELTEDAIANSEAIPEFEVIGQEETTIASGEDARIIDWQYSPLLTSVLYQAKFLVVVTDGGIAYTVEMGTDIDEYDDEFDAFGTDVLTSFTITDAPDMSDIEVEEYDTYENDQFGYSLEYPTTWTPMELLEGEVTISDEFGMRHLSVLSGPMDGLPLQEWADEIRAEMDADPRIDLLAEESITLESGHDAIVLDFELRDDGVHRGSYVLAIDEETDSGYVLVVETPEQLYDETFEEISERVIGSFSIEGTQTHTQSQTSSLGNRSHQLHLTEYRSQSQDALHKSIQGSLV